MKVRKELTSVAIISWCNHEERLPSLLGAIGSVKNTKQPVEIIVVDNFGEEDLGNRQRETIDTLFEQGLIQAVVRFDKNRGPGHARSLAPHIAQGKYFMYMDNDIQLKPGWLEYAKSVCRKNTIATMLRGVHTKTSKCLVRKLQNYSIYTRAGAGAWLWYTKLAREITWPDHNKPGTYVTNQLIKKGIHFAVPNEDMAFHVCGIESHFGYRKEHDWII